MKIVVFTESFFPNLGGLERNTFTIASALTTLGHETTVLTVTTQTDGIVYPFKVIRTNNYRAFYNVILKSDLVFINGGVSAKICAIALLLQKKYMLLYANSTFYVRENKPVSTLLRKWIAEKAFLNIALSDFAKQHLKKLLKNKRVEKLQNPIDGKLEMIADAKNRSKPDKKYDILFAGRIIEGKGIFLLIDALEKLQNQMRQFQVAFAGDGEHLDQLKEYAREKKVKVYFLGRLENEEIIETYLESKVLIVPSTSHSEGNPLVIAEAISLGLPVIASNQDAMIEAVGDAGYIFKSGDTDDLVQKIDWLFQQKNLIVRTNNTISRKEIFTYAQYKISLNQIIKSVL